MALRILNQREVTRLLPMAECIEAMAGALRALAGDRAQLPLRTVVRLADGRSFFGVMPAELQDPPAFGAKIISVFPGNEGTSLDSHQGVVLLFDVRNGAPEALLDASSITAIRTAAVSGVATRALALPDAGDLAILGSGVQARTHLEAMAVVCRLRRVRVWSRRAESAASFAQWSRDRLRIEVEPVSDPAEAVKGADLICTVTASPEPVLRGQWIRPGCHVNAAGSSTRATRELDTAAVVRGKLVVDRRESALNEAGDFLIPRAEGAVSDGHILGELGEVLLNRVQPRTDPADITIFKSLGLAIEDLAAGELVLRKAEAAGAGLMVEIGGKRDE
jgi:alanine dehydrogenase